MGGTRRPPFFSWDLHQRRSDVADNLFTDISDRPLLLNKYSRIPSYVMDWESTFGDPNTFKNAEEGLEFYQGALEEIGKLAAQVIRPKAAEL
ncbi:hypothetical protein EBR03_09130, partial [bacterium]|nr:hypothetical protein [bacterium]